MASSNALSLGNHVYLYQLFLNAIPCGKQTIATQFEEVLEAADLCAEDLGFASTRELLEELDDCIKLTVFKGGRIYATIIAQPAWDEALAAGAKKNENAGAKSWKKKKGNKSLKPVRPRLVPKKEESAPAPQPEPVPAAEPAQGTEAAADELTEAEVVAVDVTPDDCLASAADKIEDAEAAQAPENPENPAACKRNSNGTSATSSEDEPVEAVINDVEQEAPAAPEPEAPRPAVTLTVLYDPDNANAGTTTLESTPCEEPARTQASQTATESSTQTCESAPVSEQASAPESAAVPQAAAPAQPVPQAPAFDFSGYPTDFSTEVYCSGQLLSTLAALLPLGADALGITGEYYWIAREAGTIQATRSRASFPLKYTRDGERHEVRIEIRRRTGNGAAWAIESIEA